MAEGNQKNIIFSCLELNDLISFRNYLRTYLMNVFIPYMPGIPHILKRLCLVKTVAQK